MHSRLTSCSNVDHLVSGYSPFVSLCCCILSQVRILAAIVPRKEGSHTLFKKFSDIWKELEVCIYVFVDSTTSGISIFV